MVNLDSILESKDITLLTKVYIVKAMVSPVIMHGCESWTVKKANRYRIDAFELHWRDRSCLAHSVTVVCINFHSKEEYMTLQTFSEVSFFLKLLKTFTGSWYKLCPIKTGLLCRLFGKVRCSVCIN